jgi:PEGA domain-containing protein
MSMPRTIASLSALLLAAILANATSHTDTIHIKVLDSQTRAVNVAGGDVPKNCDQVNFDAYCNNSKTTSVTNTLLVQEADGRPFHIACTIDSRFSRCVPLPKGETFEAKKGKRGVTVYYVDDKGKARSQLYAVLDGDKKAELPVTALASPPPSTPPARAPSPHAAAPLASPPATAPASPSAAAQEAQGPEVDKARVKCNFTTTPAGAEITLDGKYVGSTPSEIMLATGSHEVSYSMPGFAQWKRELTVIPGSELTVSATLEK